MYSLLFIVATSFILSFLLTPMCRNLARRCGALDYPDSDRKIHPTAIPRIGGIPIVLASFASVGLVVLVQFKASHLIISNLTLAFRLLPAAVLMFLTGLLDDLWGLRPWQKLAGQFIAISTAIAGGVQIGSIAGYHLTPWLGIPITLLWLVGCTNALNLIDGVDGLAAGVALFATATTLIAALLQHNVSLALATAPLVGATLGFLRYNFNPASIFLGDSGSLLLGFLLGSYGVVWSQKSATILGMTAPLIAHIM